MQCWLFPQTSLTGTRPWHCCVTRPSSRTNTVRPPQKSIASRAKLVLTSAKRDCRHCVGLAHTVESVIVRFFYDVDRGRTGKITAKQFRQSKFMSVLQAVDEAPDINQVRQGQVQRPWPTVLHADDG